MQQHVFSKQTNFYHFQIHGMQRFSTEFLVCYTQKIKIKTIVMIRHHIATRLIYSNTSNNIADENISKIWIRIPFLGKQGEYLVKKLIRKLQRNLTKPVKFIVIYQTKKVSYFLSNKDKIPELKRNDLV